MKKEEWTGEQYGVGRRGKQKKRTISTTIFSAKKEESIQDDIKKEVVNEDTP